MNTPPPIDPAHSPTQIPTDNRVDHESVPEFFPSPKGRHRPKGKIARLPAQLREEINIMLRDGLSYPAIIKNFQERGLPELLDISEQNISNWKNGGHQHWLTAQEWRAEIQELRDEAIKFPGANDRSKLEQATLRIASLRLFEFFKQLNTETFAAAARANPDSLFRLFAALPRITRESLRYQKYRDTCAETDAAFESLCDSTRKLALEQHRILLLMIQDIIAVAGKASPEDVEQLSRTVMARYRSALTPSDQWPSSDAATPAGPELGSEQFELRNSPHSEI